MNKTPWRDDIRDFEAPQFQLKVTQACQLNPQAVFNDFVWVKSVDEFTQWIEANGLPEHICFDHDLGDNVPSGMDAAKWLTNYCLDNNKKLPTFGVHSDNPAGKVNIESLLFSFMKFQS